MKEIPQVICPYCHRDTETVWWVTINWADSPDVLPESRRVCPGDVADLRLDGVKVRVGMLANAA